ESIVSTFLDYEDADVVSSALTALIRGLGRTTYCGRLMEFVEGVEWDTEEHLRLVAIQLSADCLSRCHDKHLGGALLNVLDQRDEDHDPLAQGSFLSLAAAIGLDRNQLKTSPETALLVALSSEVISHARALFGD